MKNISNFSKIWIGITICAAYFVVFVIVLPIEYLLFMFFLFSIGSLCIGSFNMLTRKKKINSIQKTYLLLFISIVLLLTIWIPIILNTFIEIRDVFIKMRDAHNFSSSLMVAIFGGSMTFYYFYLSITQKDKYRNISLIIIGIILLGISLLC